MAQPPFNDLRLKPNEWPKQERLEEILDGMQRNFEDAYQNFSTQTNLREATSRRIIAGTVEASGAVNGGSGFTVAHPSTGVYVVTLKEELKTLGLLAGVAVIGGVAFVLGSAGKKEFSVNTRKSLTELENSPFGFVISQT